MSNWMTPRALPCSEMVTEATAVSLDSHNSPITTSPASLTKRTDVMFTRKLFDSSGFVFWHQCHISSLLPQEAQLSLRRPDRTAYIWKPASDFDREESNFPEWLQSHTSYGTTLLHQTLQLSLKYDTIHQRTSDGGRQKLCIQNCNQTVENIDIVTIKVI